MNFLYRYPELKNISTLIISVEEKKGNKTERNKDISFHKGTNTGKSFILPH